MTLTTPTTVEEALHENAPSLPEKARVITIIPIRQPPKLKEDVQDLLFTEHGPLEDDDYKGSNAVIKESKKEKDREEKIRPSARQRTNSKERKAEKERGITLRHNIESKPKSYQKKQKTFMRTSERFHCRTKTLCGRTRYLNTSGFMKTHGNVINFSTIVFDT